MQNLTYLALALQTLLTTTALKLAWQTRFSQRVGAPLDGLAFVQTLLFGFIDQPTADLNSLSATAAINYSFIKLLV